MQNGVWVGQEPSWESPINRGAHCAKGASVRELVHGDRRLKYPMKLAQRSLVALAEASDRRVIRRLVSRDDPDRDIVVAASLDASR